MRKLLAMLLLAFVGLPAAAPAFALEQSAAQTLAACCRKHGAHHCMDSMVMSATHDGPSVRGLCPMMQHHAATTAASQQATTLATPRLIAAPTFLLLPAQRAAAQRRISRERSRHKRGPPAVRLA